ncbi:MAG: DNA-binding protein [Lachnospira sp.]|nr:DNA-binding protein [Lachnospira sp.]
MKNPIYYNAVDIAEMLNVSKATAYSIIRKLNEELNSKGYITLQGKVAKVYFDEKWYGLTAN